MFLANQQKNRMFLHEEWSCVKVMEAMLIGKENQIVAFSQENHIKFTHIYVLLYTTETTWTQSIDSLSPHFSYV